MQKDFIKTINAPNQYMKSLNSFKIKSTRNLIKGLKLENHEDSLTQALPTLKSS